jgi:ElaB/YqjD/DUF883 family membrane-anchored ribosome-binding protein
MGEQDTQIHEISDARARMSELADEMARRMEPEHLKELAAGKVTELKEQARERATDKVDELKTHAKEAVMRRTTEIKDRADTPKGWSMLGAIIGAGVGSVLMKKVFDIRTRGDFEDRRLYGRYDMDSLPLVPAPEGGLMRPTGDVRGTMGSDIGVRTSTDVGTTDVGGLNAGVGLNTGSNLNAGGNLNTGGGLKERASDVMDTAKHKASDIRDRASGLVDQARDKALGLRERIPDRGEMRHRATDWYGTVSDNPVLLAIGGLAIGAVFASFIPVTRRERQLIEPAKSKVKERISTLGDQLESKLSGQPDHMSEDEELHASVATESQNERGSIPPLPPLDDYNTSVH